MQFVRVLSLAVLVVAAMSAGAEAQIEAPAPQEQATQEQAAPQEDKGSLDKRLDLAEKMQALNPARDQVNVAISRYVEQLAPENRDAYRAALQNVLNYQALERIAIDAYAEIFTEAELEAMVEYHSRPEAISARAKEGEWSKKVYPEIIRLMDQAMMRVRTGGTGQ